MKFSRRSLFLTPALAMAQAQPERIMRLKTRPSKQVQASPLGIGFETLDRDMFDPERTYSHLAELGVKWARCQTGWAKTEKTKGQFDFSWLDRVVDSLLGIGIQPWFNLGYGNTLYTPGPKHPSAVGWAPLNSEEARAAWVRYTGAITRRYADRVKHWEIWNEPNIPNFWQPDKPSAARYVDLVRMTAPVIRENVPGAVLIGGAFAGVAALDYFEACYEAGLLDLVDKISYHPYRAIPEDNYEADMRAFRGLIDRYKPGMPVWQGENGAPSTLSTAGALRQYEWDEIRQAKWLLRRVLTDLSMGVELTSYFHTVDMHNYIWGSGQTSLNNTKGVLRGGDYTPKPSYYAYRNACALFDAETKAAGLLLRIEQAGGALDERAVRTATFLRQGAPVLLYWYPADLQKGFEATTCRLLAWSGKAGSLKDPVLVDLLHGEVHPVADAKWNGGTLVIPRVPLRDYPIVLTDRSLTL
jgi:hypothetical protein